jgi:ankyrin repeat protein
MEELPDSLDETYERMLREIRKPNQGHARRMLQCLVAAVRPLRVAELAEVLAFDFVAAGTPKLNPDWRWEDHEEAVMSTCSSLVMIVDDKGESEDERKVEDSRIVQFSHFSVKEFLMSDRLAESSREATVSQYHIQLEPAHTILAQACLGVLLRLDDRINRDNIDDFPLARYAAQYWIDHARFGNVSSVIKGEMECLFDPDKPHFMAWLWIYNEDWETDSMSTMSPEKPEAVPLYYAALLGFRDLTAHLLAERPEDAYAEGGFELTPLHASARRGHVDAFSLLVDHFPNPDIRGVYDQTPLLRTSYNGHLEIGKRLLDRGANIDARDRDGWTPLFVASLGGQVEFTRMLLERGASINTPANDGTTPLHKASERSHVEVVLLLLESGADLNARDGNDRTPSDSASGHKRGKIVELLAEYGAKSIKK